MSQVRQRKFLGSPAQSETPDTPGQFLHENRETFQTSREVGVSSG